MNPITNFITILLMNVPVVLRKAIFNGLLSVFGAVLNRINVRSVYQINHSGEEASLEHYLNDQYGIAYHLPNREADIVANNIIWIDDGSNMEETYLFNTAEFAPNTYLFNESEGEPPHYIYNFIESNAGVEFKVKVPSWLAHNEAQLLAHVRTYRQGGARFIKTLY